MVMCTHFRSYLRGAQFTLRTDHSSLRWLQKFRNSDGMLTRWYMLLGQFSVMFEYRICRYHDSIFGGHLGVSRTYRLLDRVYWPGLRQEVRSYLSSCSVCLARKSPCPRRVPMGHMSVGHRWDQVAMDILDMSVTTPKGNRYVLVTVDCFSRLMEACPLPNKTALAIANAFFQLIVCRFGMPAVIHLREFENNLMQELCLLCGAHKSRMTRTARPVMGCWNALIGLC